MAFTNSFANRPISIEVRPWYRRLSLPPVEIIKVCPTKFVDCPYGRISKCEVVEPHPRFTFFLEEYLLDVLQRHRSLSNYAFGYFCHLDCTQPDGMFGLLVRLWHPIEDDISLRDGLGVSCEMDHTVIYEGEQLIVARMKVKDDPPPVTFYLFSHAQPGFDPGLPHTCQVLPVLVPLMRELDLGDSGKPGYLEEEDPDKRPKTSALDGIREQWLNGSR